MLPSNFATAPGFVAGADTSILGHGSDTRNTGTEIVMRSAKHYMSMSPACHIHILGILVNQFDRERCIGDALYYVFYTDEHYRGLILLLWVAMLVQSANHLQMPFPLFRQGHFSKMGC